MDPVKKLTKRIFLSKTSKLFDPLGWLTPLIIQFNILMQQTWFVDCPGMMWCQRMFLQPGTIYNQVFLQYTIFRYLEPSSATQLLNWKFILSLMHQRKLLQRLSLVELQIILAMSLRHCYCLRLWLRR